MLAPSSLESSLSSSLWLLQIKEGEVPGAAASSCQQCQAGVKRCRHAARVPLAQLEAFKNPGIKCTHSSQGNRSTWLTPCQPSLVRSQYFAFKLRARQ